MKRMLFLSCLLAGLSFNAHAQTPYLSGPDEQHPEVTVLTGIISKYTLQNLPMFGWYQTNYNGYTPDSSLVNALEKNKETIQVILFAGTWCDDSQFIIPKFFHCQEKSGFPDSHVSFFGVNRNKQTLGNIAQALNITNVPTFIVMKNGKELGRVVEYGKTGKWDAELAQIILSGN